MSVNDYKYKNDYFKNYENANIITGPPVYIRKKFAYIAHVTTTYSVEHAATVIDHISEKTGCPSLPFAIRLIEGNELIAISEDNGEFACGDVLSKCLSKIDGYNVLVCVSKKVSGMFVTDMVQCQKHHAVLEAATKALDLLRDHLMNKNNSVTKQQQQQLLNSESQLSVVQVRVPSIHPPQQTSL